MLIFLDTEYTDFTNCELISLGMVSEDGQRSLYLESADFDRLKCNTFVQNTVLPLLGQIEGATVFRAEMKTRLHNWLASLPRNVTLACDSQHDRDLLADVLDGQWPDNFQDWFDLRPLIDTGVFDHAVAKYHTPDRPWHHALYDAHAHRAGWLAWMDANKNRVR